MTLSGFSERRGAPSNKQPPRNREREQLQRYQSRVAGVDTSGMAYVPGVEGYQEAIPELDIRLTWDRKNEDGTHSQGIALTVRSRRAGLELQRDFLKVAHARQAEADLVSNVRDEEILAFETTQQFSVPSPYTIFKPGMLNCMFKGRLVMTRRGGFNPGDGTYDLFAETSPSDPTIMKCTISTGLGTLSVKWMDTIQTPTGEKLVISLSGTASPTSVGFFVIETLAASTTGTFIPTTYFFDQVDPNPDDDVTPPPLLIPYGPDAFVQSPSAGSPLVVKSLDGVWLQPIEPNPDFPGQPWGPATQQFAGGSGGVNEAIGFNNVSGRKPKAYFLGAGDGFTFKLSSVNSVGLELEKPNLSIAPLYGAANLPERGAIAFTNGYRVVIWDGHERETGLFADERVPEGQTLYCTGLWKDNGSLWAQVVEVPEAEVTSPYPDLGTQVGVGRIREQMRKYDFELKRWHSVSDWVTLTEEGTITWDWNGLSFPIPDASVDLKYGFLPGFGSPHLPFGAATQNMHNYINSRVIGFTPTDTAPFWIHKFEQPLGVNPYSYLGSNKRFATRGNDRSPGLLFEDEALYANKYLDSVFSGAVDSGGPGSSWTFRMAEYSHLDDVDDDGNRLVIEHTFEHGLPHEARHRDFNSNKTAMLVPQWEWEINVDTNAEGYDPSLTPQILPFTLYMHVDLPRHTIPDPQDPKGRSKA